MTFSATEAAFEGFRVVRRHPLAIVFWTLAYVVFFVALFGLFAGPLATMMATTESLEGTQPSPQELEALGQTWFGFMALVLPLFLVIGAVLNTAVARAVLRPADKAFGYMKLGGDELRVLAVTLLLSIVFFAVSVVLFTVVGVVAGVSAQANAGVGILLGVLLGLGALALVIWLAVRLCLAVPDTFHEKRISPFGSFALTKGQVFPLLGMAIIAFIMSLLVNFLGAIIALPITVMTGGMEQLATMDGQTTAQILRTAGPGLLGWGVVNSFFAALQIAVAYAPFSAAYRELKGLPHE